MSEVNNREIKETPEIQKAIELSESEKRGFCEDATVRNAEQSEVKTSIDDKVTEVPKQELPDDIKESFEGGEYKTVVTDEPITVYRVFGNEAKSDGGFATTEKPFDALSSKMDLALKPEWKNSKQYYEEITIPEGTEINIGRVAKQETHNRQELSGGADQILLPENWDKSWASESKELKARPFEQLVQAEKDIHESNK